MSVGTEGIYDFILQDRTTNPRLELGLILDQEEGRKRWREFRVKPIPPRRSSGSLLWTHKDPISDFVYAMDDWSGGGLIPYYRDESTRYAKSNGMDLTNEGVAALGIRRGTPRAGGTIKSRIQSSLFLVNGDWEEGQVVGWAAGTGTTLTVDTATVNSGNYAGKAVVAQSTSAGAIATLTLGNPTVYRNRQIKVMAYLRRSAGSDAGVFLRINDGVATADSAAITADAYGFVSATITVNGSATALTVEIRTNATLSTDAHTFYIDDCFMIPTGGVQSVGSAIRSIKDADDDIYATIGRAVVKWNESTFVWDAVYIDATRAATAIIEFNDIIYVAFGEAAGATPHQYIYGTDTSWTTAALNATTTHQDNHARYWVKAKNAFGNWALWKAGPSTGQGVERYTIQSAEDPTTAWTPSIAFTVGSNTREITGLHRFRDVFVVAKTDGLWAWDDTLVDFVNLIAEWEDAVSTDNGAIGQPWHNSLLLTAARQGFLLYTGDQIIPVDPLLSAPRLTNFGGRVTAMVGDARRVFLGLDHPTADTSTTKTARLAQMSIVDGKFRIHPLAEPSIALIDHLTFHLTTRLWAFGRTYNSDLSDYIPAVNMWFLPSKTVAAYADPSAKIEATGWFEPSIWHGNMPDTDKAIIACTIWCEDLDANHTIQLDFGREGRAASERRAGTFNSSDRIQTIYFKNIDNPAWFAVCRFFQPRFTFTTIDATSPKMYAFAFHTQLAPNPIRAWETWCVVGDGTYLRSGVQEPASKANIEAIFGELEDQAFPLTMTHDFGQSHSGDATDGADVRQVRIVDYERVPTDDLQAGQEVWRLRLQEVPVDG